MSTKLYVGNLAFSIDQTQLERAFAPHGTLLSAIVVNDRASGRSRGFGFVEYTSAEDAQLATSAMNGTDLDGRSLYVSVARPQGERGGA